MTAFRTVIALVLLVAAISIDSMGVDAKRGLHLKHRNRNTLGLGSQACSSFANDATAACMQASSCRYCMPIAGKRCIDKDDAGVEKFVSYGAVSCFKNAGEANAYADLITHFLANQEFTVSNPTTYRRLFGGRFQVIVGEQAFEFSSGTSNANQQTTGIWLPSGGYKYMKGDFVASNVCQFEQSVSSAYGWPFLNFGPAIFKGGGLRTNPEYKAIVEGFTGGAPLKSMLDRFDNLQQMRASMYLANHCEKLFAGTGLAQNFLTKVISECQGAQALWARLRPILKLPPTQDESLQTKVAEAANSQFMRTLNGVQLNTILAAHGVKTDGQPVVAPTEIALHLGYLRQGRSVQVHQGLDFVSAVYF
jgi:hypothetical protein